MVMETMFYDRSLQNETDELERSCSSQRCSACLKEDGCSWCNGNASSSGSCHAQENPSVPCRQAITTDSSQCPSIGADVVLRNVSGLLGAMVAVAIILNVINRFSNKRRNAKLRKSIFTLPVYVYPSTEKKAAAVKQARELLHSQASTKDMEEAVAGTTDDGDDENNAVVTCTICLAAYEEEEVIKVLPCGHDFHAECLDCWLECKAVCPLCKMPAFAKNTPRRGNATSPVHAHSPTPGPAANRPTSYRSSRAASLSSDRPRGFESVWGGSRADVDGVELHALAIAPPRRTPTSGSFYLRTEEGTAAGEAVVAGRGGALGGVGGRHRAGTELVRDDRCDDEMKTTCGGERGSKSEGRSRSRSRSGSGIRRGSRTARRSGSRSDSGSESVPAGDTDLIAADDAANPPSGSDAVGVVGGGHLQGAGGSVGVGPSAPPPRAGAGATTTPEDGWRPLLRVSPGGPDDVDLYDVEAGQPASAPSVAVANGTEADSRADGAEACGSPPPARFVEAEV